MSLQVLQALLILLLAKVSEGCNPIVNFKLPCVDQKKQFLCGSRVSLIQLPLSKCSSAELREEWDQMQGNGL